MFSFEVPQVDEIFYDLHEAEFLFFISNYANRNYKKHSKKVEDKQFENFTGMFKTLMLCPTKQKLVKFFDLPLIKILWSEIFTKTEVFKNWK